MADYLTTDTELTSIANAIRTKGGTSASLTYPNGFITAINAIPSGGMTVTRTQDAAGGDILSITGTATEVEALPVTANGTYTATSGKAYSPVTVNVPNSYSSSDNGKVVSNGALVSQTSATYTTNNTYDTTLINSVTVSVSGGSIATGTFSITGSSSFHIWYTDSSLAFQDILNSSGGTVTDTVPLNTIVVASGSLSGISSVIGLTQISSYRTSVIWYKVTG